MSNAQAHRVAMTFYLVPLLGMLILGNLMGGGGGSEYSWVPVIIFLFFGVVGAVSFVGMIVFGKRLAEEHNIELFRMPVWLWYLSGVGVIFALWLDRKAASLSAQSKGEPDFGHEEA